MSKDLLKINFVDFWPNLVKTDNYFYHLLSTEFDVVIDEEDPDILFHSYDYFNEENHKKYNDTKSIKVFYTGENTRPDFEKSHFAFTFDHSDDERNYRLPLWALHINWFDVEHTDDRDQSYLHNPNELLEKKINMDEIMEQKKEFCSFVFTQPRGQRVSFFETINSYKPVCSAGRLFNNTNWTVKGRGDQRWKIDFLKLFKFNVSFENTSNPGYCTEKIIHPMFTNTIPIYWGSSTVTDDFNEKSFVLLNEGKTAEEVVSEVEEIDTDPSLYESVLSEPWFKDGKFPDQVLPENVMRFFKEKILK
jgi:hypothetical protein